MVTHRIHSMYQLLVIILLAYSTGVVTPIQAAGTCGTGTWTPGNLEIHHINVGQGDSALIVGPTGKSLLLDAGETTWNASSKAQIVGVYVESVLGCKSLDYVLISHFHLDHIGYVGYGGLWNLVEIQNFTVGTTLVRNYNTYLGATSGTFTNWKSYLEGAGQAKLHPVIAVEGTSQLDLGAGVTFKIVALDGNGALIAGNFSGDASPPSENDYSIGAVLSYGNFDEWLGGDLDGEYHVGGFGYTYHDIELSTAPEVGDVDVYKANHHSSSHSSSATFINQLDPEVSVISLGDSNSYGYPPQTTMDRLLATSTVYMTQRGDLTTNIGSAIVAGNIVIKTSNGTNYTVNGAPYIATEPVRTDSDGDGYFVEADLDDHNASLKPAPNGGCGPLYQNCGVSTVCQVNIGQVLINEVLPAPSDSGQPEWVELYNTTSSSINIGYCIVDDIAAGSPAYQIPANTFIPAHGFWTLDRITYFNNTGDDVRFLNETASTILDSYTYGSTGPNLAWYRLPDGGTWANSPTASTTKGVSNTIPFYPIVLSSTRVGENPTSDNSVDFTVTFSKVVTGVNVGDFQLTTTGGITGSFISGTSGSGATYTVTVNTGAGSGMIRLDVIDDDSIRDGGNQPLGGAGAGNGSYTSGEVYTIYKMVVLTGNVGIASAILSYIDGVSKSVTADNNGNYSITVPSGWSGTVTPSRTGFTFVPASQQYTNLTAGQSNQNYLASWVGGITIQSDQNVVAVGRPHIGSEVASYGGFTSGSLTAYVPMLFKTAYGSYDSALYVQNVHETNTADINIKYYDSNGALKCTKADTIAPLSSKGYWVPTATCDSGSLPGGWVGGVVVTSNQPIVAVGRPHVGGEVMTYDGFASGSLSTYVPMLFKSAFGGAYNAAFYIQNTHDTSTANITIKYYNDSGLLNCTKTDTIAPLASKGYWVPTATCDSGLLPAGWVGGVVVTSDQPIVAVGRPHIGSQVTTYTGFPSGNLNSYVPMLFKGAFGSYDSAFYLQNTHDTNTANITIQYYDSNGVLNCTKTDTIAPLASKGYWVPTATCNSGSLPAGWLGGVVVTSDQPLVAVGRPHLGTQVTTYNGFMSGSLNAYVPMLFRDGFGGSYDSALYLQNLHASNTANITIKLYDASGNLACTVTDTLSALASKGYWLPGLLCPP